MGRIALILALLAHTARYFRGFPMLRLDAMRPARRQVFAYPFGLSHGDRGARHRAPDDADRPAVHRRDRTPARWLRPGLPAWSARRHAAARAAAAADRPDRWQPAARPYRRLPR